MTLTVYSPNGKKKIYHQNADYSTDKIAYSIADIERLLKEYSHLPDFTAVIS